jgi:hypothetical protein
MARIVFMAEVRREDRANDTTRHPLLEYMETHIYHSKME